MGCHPGPNGVIHLTPQVAEESLQCRLVPYDKGADEHYDTASFPGHHVAQRYLPNSVAARRFYALSDQGMN
ncbi:MAG: hypothetical protein KIT87_27325 [Anaerolineae bacterium]|nr:hypothetical protein [Anaerolineae bacterium]